MFALCFSAVPGFNFFFAVFCCLRFKTALKPDVLAIFFSFACFCLVSGFCSVLVFVVVLSAALLRFFLCSRRGSSRVLGGWRGGVAGGEFFFPLQAAWAATTAGVGASDV